MKIKKQPFWVWIIVGMVLLSMINTVAKGQEQTLPDSLLSYSTMPVLAVEYEKYLVLSILYQQAYINHCYADSFQVKVDPNITTPLIISEMIDDFEEDDGILDETGVGWSTAMGGYKLIWRHTQPTFEGYTEWLKNIIKKQ